MKAILYVAAGLMLPAVVRANEPAAAAPAPGAPANTAAPVVITDKHILAITKPDNWIHDEKIGLRFRVPDQWRATTTLPAGQGAGTIVFSIPERAAGANAMFSYRLGEPPPPASERDAEVRLRDEAQARESGRLARTPTYRNRAGSFQFRMVNDQPSLAWFADYDHDGVRWSEYVVRVRGAASFGSLVVRAPADRVDALQVPADAMIASLQLP